MLGGEALEEDLGDVAVPGRVTFDGGEEPGSQDGRIVNRSAGYVVARGDVVVTPLC
ncbi:hypothetical protein [Leifsonia poae]|uniref:hypothetical protein n=1 Tax=Leifsonia poae TaxID=110933 RepID=UPI001CBFD152|nr:hypothetical protein [Leifsonia poae]